MTQLPRFIKIIYASTSGNVEATCEYMANVLQGHHFEVDLERSEVSDAADLIRNQLFIFATSTWEHGEINPYFEPVLNDFKHLDLSGKYAAIVGLGDIRYEPVLFCKGADIIKEEFEKAGGTTLYNMLKVNGEPYHQFDNGHIGKWTHGFIDYLVHNDKVLLT